MSKLDLTSYPKDKIKVLFLENISDKAIQYFKQQGYTDVKKVAGALSEEDLIKAIKENFLSNFQVSLFFRVGLFIFYHIPVHLRFIYL